MLLNLPFDSEFHFPLNELRSPSTLPDFQYFEQSLKPENLEGRIEAFPLPEMLLIPVGVKSALINSSLLLQIPRKQLV